jgi:hypothetical protein
MLGRWGVGRPRESQNTQFSEVRFRALLTERGAERLTFVG